MFVSRKQLKKIGLTKKKKKFKYFEHGSVLTNYTPERSIKPDRSMHRRIAIILNLNERKKVLMPNCSD